MHYILLSNKVISTYLWKNSVFTTPYKCNVYSACRHPPHCSSTPSSSTLWRDRSERSSQHRSLPRPLPLLMHLKSNKNRCINYDRHNHLTGITAARTAWPYRPADGSMPSSPGRWPAGKRRDGRRWRRKDRFLPGKSWYIVSLEGARRCRCSKS
jgi:hypothetical protein